MKINPVFWTSFFDQKETVETLTEESHASADFYVLLAGSTVITTLGLLMNSSVVIIGGMLVAPLLFPILSLGMGITMSSKQAIKRSLTTIWKSIFFVISISFFIAFLLNPDSITQTMQFASQTNISSFLVALVSGVVASYAWVRQNTNSTLPGVAVSVALLPPLATFGIGISMFEKTVTSGALFLFIINILGIAIASVVIFALFGFSRLQKVQEKIIKEEKMNDVSKEISDEDIVVEKIDENAPIK
jgi:uncharacterized hydrophobic protein (TIGR00271 family)